MHPVVTPNKVKIVGTNASCTSETEITTRQMCMEKLATEINKLFDS